jgi:hypothetical protein
MGIIVCLCSIFGQSHDHLEEWKFRKETQRIITGSLRKGRWVDSYAIYKEHLVRPMYVKPCTQEGQYFEYFWYSPSLANKCFNSLENQGWRYSWVPDESESSMHPFSPSGLCKVLNGRNVMVVGDSISGEFFFTFVSAMLFQAFTNEQGELDGPRYSKNKELCENICDWDKPCTGPIMIDCGDEIPSFTISHERNTLLNDVSSWIGRVAQENISLVIMNTGLHVIEGTVSRVRETVQSLYTMHPNIDIVWRTNFVGHEYCVEKFSNPPPTMMTDENFSHLNMTPSVSDEMKKDYKWDYIKGEDIKVQQMLVEEMPRVLILDVGHSTEYRSDSHSYDRVGNIDCIHYCMPGPIDSWLTFLYNALLRVSDLAPTLHSATSDQRAVEIVTKQTGIRFAEGLILQAHLYPGIFYQIENGKRRVITNPTQLAYIKELHVTSKTYHPQNASQVMIETIDEDYNFYGIVPGRPIV